MEIFLFVVLGLLGLICLVGVALGLPGHWVLLGLALLMEVSDSAWLPEGEHTTFGWGLLITVALLGGVGEVIEFGAASYGARKGGGSKRGAWGGLLGGIAGGIMGILIPFPVLGSLIGAFVGTFAGTFLGETTGPEAKQDKDSLKPALWATAARALGTASKLSITLVSLIALLALPWILNT